MASADDGPSLSKFMMREATSRQFAEFLIHRSLYHLKEADPHTWAIPRLSGSVKAAMVAIQADEYGGGATPAMHAQLFRSLLSDWDLHDAYGHYLDQVPGVTLMATNLISMFGLHRRWRGALVGHLAMFEMTSSVPNARYARAHRRLGGGEEAALFFDEHVVADSVHDQIALHDLAGGLISHEPHARRGHHLRSTLCRVRRRRLRPSRPRPLGSRGLESSMPRTARAGGVVSAEPVIVPEHESTRSRRAGRP